MPCDSGEERLLTALTELRDELRERALEAGADDRLASADAYDVAALKLDSLLTQYDPASEESTPTEKGSP